MTELLTMLPTLLERSLIFSFIVAAVYIASRFINFDNLAIEGAFGIGGAVSAVLVSWGINPWISILGSVIIGGLSGIATGLLHTQLRLNTLISGIIVTTGLFSVTLKIAGSNKTLMGNPTIFTHIPSPLTVIPKTYVALFILAALYFSIFSLISWFLTTEVGFILRATGSSPQVLTNMGKNSTLYTCMGLTISNMLAALTGALFVQYTGYFSIWANIGVLIIGLTGMILTHLFTPRFSYALLIGSFIYQAIITLTFELNLDQDWNKLMTALLMIAVIAIKQSITKNNNNKRAPHVTMS